MRRQGGEGEYEDKYVNDVLLAPYRSSLTCRRWHDSANSETRISVAALIRSLALTGIQGKDLGLDLTDYIGSWCTVGLRSAEDKQAHWKDLDAATVALLHCYPDQIGGKISGAINFTIFIGHEHWLALAEATPAEALPTFITLHLRSTHPAEAFTRFEDASGWMVRFASVEFTYGEEDVTRPHNAKVQRLFESALQPYKGKKKLPISGSLTSVQHSLAKWVTAAPISGDEVECEVSNALEMLSGLDEFPPKELGWGIRDYFAKPWADCADLEKAILRTLVADRCDELIKELESGIDHVGTARRLRQSYAISPLKVKAYVSTDRHQIGSVALIIIVSLFAGYSYGWSAGLLALAVLGFLQSLKNAAETSQVWFSSLRDVSAIVADLSRTRDDLRTEPLSPRYTRERLEELEKLGVDWHWGTLQIARHAEARSAHKW